MIFNSSSKHTQQDKRKKLKERFCEKSQQEGKRKELTRRKEDEEEEEDIKGALSGNGRGKKNEDIYLVREYDWRRKRKRRKRNFMK